METYQKKFYVSSYNQIKSFFDFAEGWEVKSNLQKDVCPGHYIHPLTNRDTDISIVLCQWEESFAPQDHTPRVLLCQWGKGDCKQWDGKEDVAKSFGHLQKLGTRNHLPKLPMLCVS